MGSVAEYSIPDHTAEPQKIKDEYRLITGGPEEQPARLFSRVNGAYASVPGLRAVLPRERVPLAARHGGSGTHARAMLNSCAHAHTAAHAAASRSDRRIIHALLKRRFDG